MQFHDMCFSIIVHSPPSNVKIKNEWMYTTTFPTYVCDVYGDNLTKYCYNDQMKEVELGEAYGTCGVEGKYLSWRKVKKEITWNN
jgi:hypothetical protein